MSYSKKNTILRNFPSDVNWPLAFDKEFGNIVNI